MVATITTLTKLLLVIPLRIFKIITIKPWCGCIAAASRPIYPINLYLDPKLLNKLLVIHIGRHLEIILDPAITKPDSVFVGKIIALPVTAVGFMGIAILSLGFYRILCAIRIIGATGYDRVPVRISPSQIGPKQQNHTQHKHHNP